MSPEMIGYKLKLYDGIQLQGGNYNFQSSILTWWRKDLRKVCGLLDQSSWKCTLDKTQHLTITSFIVDSFHKLIDVNYLKPN